MSRQSSSWTFNANKSAGTRPNRPAAKGWLKDNPARNIDLLREDKPEIDPFSLGEIKTFVSEDLDDAEDRRYFLVAFFAGLRPGEQIGLQWHDANRRAGPPGLAGCDGFP